MVPAAIKDVRSCGIRAVPGFVAVWLGKKRVPGAEGCWTPPMENGLKLTYSAGLLKSGLPAFLPREVPCALIVTPCGIDAMRV
jgi:hypothetical protein